VTTWLLFFFLTAETPAATNDWPVFHGLIAEQTYVRAVQCSAYLVSGQGSNPAKTSGYGGDMPVRRAGVLHI